MSIHDFVKLKRAQVKLTQPELAEKAGVGLRFIRELEQGKKTVRMDKFNQVLRLFGAELGPVELNRDIFSEKNEKRKICLKGGKSGMAK